VKIRKIRVRLRELLVKIGEICGNNLVLLLKLFSSMKKFFLLFWVLAQTVSFAQNIETAIPESVGMSTTRLKRIDATLNEYVEKGYLPGAIALVIRDGKVVYYESFGYDDVAAKTKLPKDAIVRIASQTKAITSTAVMMPTVRTRAFLQNVKLRFEIC
jgi:CubicO group peptidase (beta-lactamase class C family)